MSKLEKLGNFSGKVTIVCGVIVSCLLVFQSIVAAINKDYGAAALNTALAMLWVNMTTDTIVKVIQVKKGEKEQ